MFIPSRSLKFDEIVVLLLLLLVFVILLSQEQIPNNFRLGISSSKIFWGTNLYIFFADIAHEKIVKGATSYFPNHFKHFYSYTLDITNTK